MPKLKPDTQLARRQHILDAAELAFAKAGFHRTTMQDIARQAQVSLGALYVYFASKEDLIAGITERDRAKIAEQLTQVANAPDIADALTKLGEHYAVDEPRHKQQLVVEIGCEAMRDGAVGRIFRACDEEILERLERLFERAISDGKINPRHGARELAMALAMLGDGLFWRRAVDPSFDSKAMVPILASLVASLLNSGQINANPKAEETI